MISEAEKERRRRSAMNSEGSLAIEGQHLDVATRELTRRYVEGELDFEEFSNEIDRHVAELARSLEKDRTAASAA